MDKNTSIQDLMELVKKPESSLFRSGSSEELILELIAILEEVLGRLKGYIPLGPDEPRTKTWPYTKIGGDLLSAIDLCEVIDRKLRQNE